MSSMVLIREFLGQKRIAVVGVSREAKDFSRTLYSELRHRGYDVVPVNPEATEIDGQKCFAQLRDIQPPVDGVLVMTPHDVTGQVVRECAESGIKRVWMYRAGGKGAVDRDAVRFCRSCGIAVIPGECPFMFLSDAGWFHRLHGGWRKVFGGYPH